MKCDGMYHKILRVKILGRKRDSARDRERKRRRNSLESKSPPINSSPHSPVCKHASENNLSPI